MMNLSSRVILSLILLVLFPINAHGEELSISRKPTVLLQGQGKLELAPHGLGNIYAPDVLFENGLYRMWYGGQGKDGHDRILYAESYDGINWLRKGLALEDINANHVNDPSVVKVNGTYFLYYTRAETGVIDKIYVATSKNGIRWAKKGAAVVPGKKVSGGKWDSLLVGRPSVLYEKEEFKMWYDGRKDLPIGALSENVPQSKNSRRSIGYATSQDGLIWTKHPSPVFENNAGGIDVKRFGDKFYMAYESHSGTKIAVSKDGIHWRDRDVRISKSGKSIDKFGHVTPFLLILPEKNSVILYFGAASRSTWNYNCITSVRLTLDELRQFDIKSEK
jgi:hypothetical protein